MTRTENPDINALFQQLVDTVGRFGLLKLLVTAKPKAKESLPKGQVPRDTRLRRDIGLPPVVTPPDHIRFALFLNSNQR